MGNCQIECEFILVANENIKELTLLPKAASSASAPCVIEDVEVVEDKQVMDVAAQSTAATTRTLIMSDKEGSGPYTCLLYTSRCV